MSTFGWDLPPGVSGAVRRFTIDRFCIACGHRWTVGASSEMGGTFYDNDDEAEICPSCKSGNTCDDEPGVKVAEPEPVECDPDPDEPAESVGGFDGCLHVLAVAVHDCPAIGCDKPCEDTAANWDCPVRLRRAVAGSGCDAAALQEALSPSVADLLPRRRV